MIQKFILLFLIMVFPLFLLGKDLSSQGEIRDQIRIKLEIVQPGQPLTIRDQSLKTSDEIYAFYSNRAFREAWSSDGILTELAYELRFEIRQSKFDGLNPQAYHLGLIDAFFCNF
ncbi:hypothetical protein [Algoriphagus boritolerans]|uniref:hypothetical protein n=1 Tax=Algoriphagus boritolerans TaxID=308111 RepID=UPI000A844D85